MRNKKRWTVLLSVLLLAVFASGCTSAAQTPTSLPPSPTQPAPAATLAPTETPVPPSATPEPTATATPEPPTATPQPTETTVPTETPTETPTAAAAPAGGGVAAVEDPILMYFISENDNGPVACGDFIIGVSTGVSRSKDTGADIQLALERLFAQPGEYAFGLYNPLFRSNIRVDEVEFTSSNGLAQVYLRGKYVRPQDKCDNLRVKAQVWTTVRQFRGVKMTNIYLNRVPFGDLVSND